METKSKCPVLGDVRPPAARHTAAAALSNRDWWPNQLNLKILHQNSAKASPLPAGFDQLMARLLARAPDNRFELADYGSTNGTRVGDVRLGKQFLKDGDEISFGAVKVEFKLKK